MSSTFDAAIGFVLANEGGYSNDPADAGGPTRFGITHDEAQRHGLNVMTITVDQAMTIYRADYWAFDNVALQPVATKMLDIVVNFGVSGGMKIIQQAAQVQPDGVYGPATVAAINRLPADAMLRALCAASADHYIDIVLHRVSQLVFLKGWIRRSIRMPLP